MDVKLGTQSRQQPSTHSLLGFRKNDFAEPLEIERFSAAQPGAAMTGSTHLFFSGNAKQTGNEPYI